MNLIDILACPHCKGGLRRSGEELACTGCGRTYPIFRGVPILLPDPQGAPICNEAELELRSGYDPWLHRMILQSLTDGQVVVDVGCGNMTLDDPCIIRMDVAWTPHVDLVADVHALPFKPGTVDFFFALAVLEHLRQPFEAAAQIHEALKPGGYVYGEANFVFAYHGYPRHFFNMSLQGLEEMFASFRKLRLGVAPYQMPSFALESVLATYLGLFRGQRPAERRFAELLELVLKHPLRRYDTEIAPEDAFRVAAGGYFFGMKQAAPHETIIPAPVMKIYTDRADLRERFPEPFDLAKPENLMIWAMTEGREQHPEIDAYFYAIEPFSKELQAEKAAGASARRDRSAIRSLGLIPDPDADATRCIAEPDYEAKESALGGPVRYRASAPRLPKLGRAAGRLRRRFAGARVAVQRTLGGGRRVEPPLPDPRLIYSVCGTEEASWYLESGTFAAQEIRGALERSATRMEKLRRILDFGCGSGRILRHWRTLRGPALYGTDYNPELVAWCEANLPFARFSVNTLDGPLSYRSRSFDLVYAFSVFTHLTEAQQRHWIDELGRILRPGGYLYLTTHGEFYLPHVPAELRDHFRRGGLVVTGGEVAGTNVCAAFHPEPYVLNVLATGFRCLEFAPGRYPQDAYLLQKA